MGNFANMLIVVASFFVGGIPFGLLIARAYGIPDLRKLGSGNIGASNVLRTAGTKPAIACWLIDALKGAGPTLIAGSAIGMGGWWQVAAALAAICGHCFSPYLGFKGGRGVATSLGVILALDWRVGLIGFGIWIAIVAVTRYISLGSVAAMLCAIPLMWLFHGHQENGLQLVVAGAAVAILVTVRHAENIQRLINGTESKIGHKAKELEEESDHEQPSAAD